MPQWPQRSFRSRRRVVSMLSIKFSRRAFVLSGLVTVAAAAPFPAAGAGVTKELMQKLIDYTIKTNQTAKKEPTPFSKTMTPLLFGNSNPVLMFQIGNDEGALKERFGVTTNLSQQRIIVFSRTTDAIYFHLTGTHLRRDVSAINRKSGASLWASQEAEQDFKRQMSYWAGRSGAMSST
jgi:hypothetical protein